MANNPPSPPPTYEQATALPHTQRNTIPLRARRSMEDELRPLPPGWIRSYDPQTHHQFFVDTTTHPPRSIWHHPLDDPSITSQTHQPSQLRASTPDMASEPTDSDSPAKHTLGRKIKDHITGTTHEQRVAERKRREEHEKEVYRQHLAFRKAFGEGMVSGEPALLGRDENEQEVFLEPVGRAYPGVVGVSRVGPFLEEVRYREGMRPGRDGRYLRAVGAGQQGGYEGGWERPVGRYGRPVGVGFGGGRGMMLAPLLGGVVLAGLVGGLV
ncbi:hypothetical protein OQA88_13361 [Cercophora sp. LCS_1]